MAPCRFFAKGHCTYGASCKNSHEPVTASETSTDSSTTHQIPPKPNIKETTSKPKESSNTAGTCWFFTQGKCTYGAACRKSHETPLLAVGSEILTSLEAPTVQEPSSGDTVPLIVVPDFNRHGPGHVTAPGLNADALAFDPSTLAHQTQPGIDIATDRPLCIFFAKGYCKNGDCCTYRHDTPGSSSASAGFPEGPKEIADLSNNISRLSLTASHSQDFLGATVTFAPGAEVSEIKLSSDFSSIQITGLSPDAQSSFVVNLLAGLGFQIKTHNILVKSLGEEGSVAEVKIDDPSFAKSAIHKFDARPDKSVNSSISIKVINGNATTGTLANRFQLNTVTCTWYKPSRIAWLGYGNNADAVDAQRFLESRTVSQRTPECFVQPGARGAGLSRTLQVANLDSHTQDRDLEGLLKGQLRPRKIKLGDPSYSLSDTRASAVIEGLLRGKGALESFQWQVLPGNSKIKATATFSDRDDAAEAVRSLNNTSLPRLGNGKIFLGHMVSVKYNISCAIMNVIRGEIDKLRESIWQTGHVHLKQYPQADPKKPVVAVRVFGEDINVAEAKAALEKLLAGKVAMNGDSVLWDPYFLDPRSLTYLNELGRERKVHIHRDARKCQLSIFGSSPVSQTAVETILAAIIAGLQQSTHKLILTPDLLKGAMQGGMRRLKAKFGAAVSLNVSANPRTISVSGPASMLDDVRSFLLMNSTLTQEVDDCSVCWTEASEPLHTSCGHVYCKDCFASQAVSASDGEIPLRCLGNDGECLEIFNIQELNEMLGHTAFEELLEKAFDSHIRTHPKDFQHCPTPDCPSVYRVTATGDQFLCSSCLVSVCTACTVAHDGMSCEEHKDLSSEGMKAFQKWKKDNDVRDCPNCKTAIEKNHGCNHMECMQCSMHICWFCMETFKSSDECYTHMSEAHNNWFVE